MFGDSFFTRFNFLAEQVGGNEAVFVPMFGDSFFTTDVEMPINQQLEV